jgi:hypothetical protein
MCYCYIFFSDVINSDIYFNEPLTNTLLSERDPCNMNSLNNMNNANGEVLVSLTQDKSHPWVHIRQVKMDCGIMTVNTDGLLLRIDQFTSMMCQLKAMEHSLLNFRTHTETSLLQPVTNQLLREQETNRLTVESQAIEPQTIEPQAIEQPSNIPPFEIYGQQVVTFPPIEALTPPVSEKTKKAIRRIKGLSKKVVEKRKRQLAEDLTLSQDRVKRFIVGADNVSIAFATVLHHHIDRFVKRQCMGCFMNRSYDEEDRHEVCRNTVDYVEKYFEQAMAHLEDREVQVELSKLDETAICPPKLEMETDLDWCKRVQNIIIRLCGNSFIFRNI